MFVIAGVSGHVGGMAAHELARQRHARGPVRRHRRARAGDEAAFERDAKQLAVVRRQRELAVSAIRGE